MAKSQEEPAAESLTAEQAAKLLTRVCPSHSQFFPNEDAYRPLSEWSHNPVTGELLCSKCKRCDAAAKDYYARRKKATSGSGAIEGIRRAIATSHKLIAQYESEGEHGKERLEMERTGLRWLEAGLARMLAEEEQNHNGAQGA